MQTIQNPGLLGRFRRKFIGDKAFYRAVFALILPLIVQNTISNVVNLLDNVMVGRVGTLQMSGVAIANQLVFVYNLAIFGAISGAGIFGAQYVGAGNWEGFRQSFRFKLLIAGAITAIGIAILYIWREPLISLYLTGEGSPEDAAAMLEYGKGYLMISLACLPPFALSQCYAGTLRETGEARLPMVAALVAVLVNLVFNYIMIFGKFGFPAMGANGAALATCISRYVELAIVMIGSHCNKKFHFMKGLYRHFHIEGHLMLDITKKSIPLLANEFFWSLGMTTMTPLFSTCGLIVVPALNIASTITNLFNVFFLSMGTAVAVMIGQALGADDIEGAKALAWKLMALGLSLAATVGLALVICSRFIVNVYNTEQAVKDLAVVFMCSCAFYMLFNSITHCSYFTLRSGGKTFVTMLFDSGYTWGLLLPFSWVMVKFSGLPIEWLYPVCYLTDVAKCVIGVLVVRTGYWAKNMVVR